MADNYYGNNRYSGGSKDRRLEDIFADVDATYDYDSSQEPDIRSAYADPSYQTGTRQSGAYDRTGSASSRTSAADRTRRTSSGRTQGSSAARRQTSSSSRSRSTSRSSGTRSSASRAGGSYDDTTSRSSSRTRSSYDDAPARSSARTRASYDDAPARSSSRTRPASSSGRRTASSAAKARNNLFRKRKRKFRKYLLIYIAALIVLLIIGCIAFSSYLASYERQQPSHVAEIVVESYGSQEGIINLLTENAAKTGAADNIDAIAQSYATNIAGKKISYKENNDFRPDSPSYDITADGQIVAKVSFVPAESGSDAFHNTKWTIQSLNVTDYLPNAITITVDAPAGATVTVNGKALDDSYIESTGVPAILENSIQFLKEPPQFNTYRMSGLLSDPDVQVTDESGTALTVTKAENSYSASPAADQAFIDSVEERVYDAIDNYATYFIHMSFDLANYIVYGSDLYSYIFGSDTMDPIATALYMFEDIESYDFAERSADNYVKYADDCFTVDIKYALDMVFTDPTYEDNNQKMDATWVFVIEPLDGSWCISDIITH